MEKTLTAYFEGESLLVLKIDGELGEEEVREMPAKIASIQEMIVRAHSRSGHKISALVDISTFSGEYVAGAIEQMVKLAMHNKPFMERTAIFGGSEKAVMAGEAVVALSERDNFKFFSTESEAREWLLGA